VHFCYFIVHFCYFIKIIFFFAPCNIFAPCHIFASNTSHFCTSGNKNAHICIIYISTLLIMMHFCDVKCKFVTNSCYKVQICYIFDAYLSPRLSILWRFCYFYDMVFILEVQICNEKVTELPKRSQKCPRGNKKAQQI